MAGLKRRASQVWPEERGEQEHGLYSLHRMFDIVGTHLTHRDVLQLLRIITRHDLLPYVTLKRRRAVPPHYPVVCCPNAGQQMCIKRPIRGRATLVSQRKRRKSVTPDPKEKQTCDIRLRVRAEYCQHETALQGNVFSNKQDPLERQFERFNQANTILKSRDLGSIICDIKFSELTYLDAFWRDYINGSLLEALKGVFITDSLKQAVGHEAIKLLVNVDEEDYELGRQKLLRNLMLQALP
ncbi:death effector domain-containing protein isoform X4 [Monodelphis domestica]|uniref:death effector domain-containing protein isoform X4 n=1 Tax=Monodelphis domestica TaxID=13616 RepID=UPI0024E19ABB|nr:death effector domain-containing protein isoform X4 [Monodelphis domestica]